MVESPFPDNSAGNETPEELGENVDFSTDPEIVRLMVEGERLSFGHLFNPAFATEISMIDPLPHQRIAVYERMLPQPRLRFLLADDAGAGKTIMAGLYIREMLSRRLISRVLIIPPAGLVGNWKREMHNLFNLDFHIISGQEARSQNPFVGGDSNLVIISIDTLRGERAFSRLQSPEVAPYDLAIFDEAHKLSAALLPDYTIRRTDRYRLAEALAGVQAAESRWSLTWGARHLLLLTATPHMGKDSPYFYLWRLLEPEILQTEEAFDNYPADARHTHYIRHTKEEMVRFDGSPLYPPRYSNTFGFDLSQGAISEQTLYDQTTDYIRYFYNRAQLLNRSAARLAMAVFQRRLASSTFSLLRSLERRLAKLDGIISDLRAGKVKFSWLNAQQARLEKLKDIFEEETGDEEEGVEGEEQNEAAEEETLETLVAVNIGELEAERNRVQEILTLAQDVYAEGKDSKFERLSDVLSKTAYKDKKIIIFTEYRDTLQFLVQRLEGLGFAGRIAQIHGGMDYHQREEQVEFFRKGPAEGGATYLVATDAAGEGINLQFCWTMVNYDIPWNPARLEQRMGRIHRYKQQHDVFVANLVADKTREGQVLNTLLTKLEKIRDKLGSDKVFDVLGRLLGGASLKAYMERSLSEDSTLLCEELDASITAERVTTIEKQDQKIYGPSGEVRARLPDLKAKLELERLRYLLPGYMRRFIEKAAPFIDARIEGDLGTSFSLQPRYPSALDLLKPAFDQYPLGMRSLLTVYKPVDPTIAIFLRPGEPIFNQIRTSIAYRYARAALRGGVFYDPSTNSPYLLHVAFITIIRKADTAFPRLNLEVPLEIRLICLQEGNDGVIQECPVEKFLLIKGAHADTPLLSEYCEKMPASLDRTRKFVMDKILLPLADTHRTRILTELPDRMQFLSRGYDYQGIELAMARNRLFEKAAAGDVRAQAELTKIKLRQRALETTKKHHLGELQREPELVIPGDISFIAHALVLPTSDPEDQRWHNDEVEAIAMQVAIAHEQQFGVVTDVSTPALARQAGLIDHPGFDLLSRRGDGKERAIEVKGRANVARVELTDNEWPKACNLRDQYWLYVVYNCGSPQPQLHRVQDPFGRLIATPKGGVIIDSEEILKAAEFSEV